MQPIGSFAAQLLPSSYIGSTSPLQTPTQQLLNNPAPVTDYQGNTSSTTVNTGQNNYTGGTGGATGGTTAAAAPAPAVVDPSIYQYYDAMTGNVQSQLGRLPNQQNIGNQNIDNSYNNSLNQLLGAKNIAQRNYDTSKAQSLQDYTTNQGDVQFNTGQQTNALQRLLGAAGFGNSSVANEAVPYATGLQGANQMRGLQDIFGRNNQALDTNFGDYQNQWNTSNTELGHQRDLQKNQLQSAIDQNKSSLLAQLSGIAQQRASATPGATYAQIVAAAQPYQDQINGLGGQIDQLGQQYANPVIQANTPAYNAPSLSSYNQQGPNPNISLNSTPGAVSNLGSFATLLNGGQQQQQKQTNLAGQAALA